MKTADDVSKAYHEGCEQGRFDAIADIPHGIEKGYSVVAVVRCGECLHYCEPVVSRDTGLCSRLDRLVETDDYCSYGGRRTRHENK